jgi:hypothetical protein
MEQPVDGSEMSSIGTTQQRLDFPNTRIDDPQPDRVGEKVTARFDRAEHDHLPADRLTGLDRA